MSNGKDIIYGAQAREAMVKGINKIADAVKVTLGPRGRNVVIKKQWNSVVTKDGVTIAREISLKDPLEDAGAQLCKQAASTTNDVCGDGSTTGTILAQALVNEGNRYLSNGGNPVLLKKGIDSAISATIQFIKGKIKKISVTDANEVKFVSTISGNSEEVGKHVSDAFIKVGADGVVTFEVTKNTETVLDVVEGFNFDRGWLSQFFVSNQEKMESVLENPYILIWERKISRAAELIPLLEKIAPAQRPLLIMADEIEGDALSTLIVNHIQGRINVCAIRAPRFGEQRKNMMKDIGILTNGTYFSEDLGSKLENVTPDKLGQAKKVIITKDDTTIIEGAGVKETVDAHITSLKESLAVLDSKYDQEKVVERIAKLSSGVAVIKLGAFTEAEMTEKKYRYEDSINATKVALESGVVPGGGVTLLAARDTLSALPYGSDDEKAGIEIVKRALAVPMKTIAFNAGVAADVVIDTVSKSEYGVGFDAKNEVYVDMFKAGIIDPAMVEISALENAGSIAGIFLMTETLIVDSPDDKPKPPPQYDY